MTNRPVRSSCDERPSRHRLIRRSVTVVLRVLMIVAPVACLAIGNGTGEDTALEAAVQLMPGYRIDSLETGRLSARDDDVAFVAIDEQATPPTRQVVVLARSDDDRYRIRGKSHPVPFPARDDYWVEIHHGSLFIHEPRGGSRISQVTVHQLRYMDGRFRLIGQESTSSFHGDDPLPGEIEAAEIRVRSNFLSGRISSQRGNETLVTHHGFPVVTLETLHRFAQHEHTGH